MKIAILVTKAGKEDWKVIGEGTYDPDNEEEQSFHDFIGDALATVMMEVDQIAELSTFDIKITFPA